MTEMSMTPTRGPSVRVATLGLLTGVVIYMGLAYLFYVILLAPPWGADYPLPVRYDFESETAFTPNGGDWQLEEGWLTQTGDGDDLMVTFPALQTGTNATPYALQTAVFVSGGEPDTGLLFNLAAEDALQSGHLVTLTALPDGIVRLLAGYVDESGELTIQWTSDPAGDGSP